MSYRSIVLVKQVPDTANISGQVMKPDGTVNRAMLPAVLNPEDKVALELALQTRDGLYTRERRIGARSRAAYRPLDHVL